MKKILSLLIAFMMLSSTAFADTASELAEAFAKTAELTSYSGEAMLSAEMNKPLEFLDTIPVDDETDINPKLIAEELLKADTKIEYSYSASEDFKKLNMEMSMEFSAPIALNNNFKLDAWTKIGMWIDYDITDEKNPVYRVIYKIPFMKKYQVMDMSSQISNAMPMLDKETIKALNEKAVNALTQNAQITKNQNEYIVKLDNDGAKNYLVEIFKASKDMMPDASGAEVIDQMIFAIEDLFEKTTVLGENGITMKLSKNSQGYISAQVEELHLSFNIFDILKAYSMSTDGLDREKAFVDITFKASTKISEINKAKVTMPKLNEENANTEIFDRYNNSFKISDEPPVFKDNEIYYPLESIAKLTGNELVIKTDGDTTSITYPNGTTAEITDTAVSIDGEKTETASLITEDGKLYCTELLLYPMNISYISADYNISTNKFSLSFTVEPEQEEPELPEEYEDYEEFQPHMLFYGFNLNRLPYMKNNICYMPVYEFVHSVFGGEFEFGDNELTNTVIAENPLNIKTIHVRAGDKYVTVNGEQRPLEAPAENVEGVLNIPLSFAKELDLNAEVYSIYTANSVATQFSFSMLNPEYKEPDYIENDYDFISPSFYCYVYSHQLPYMENNEIYLPVCDLLAGMFDGEFTFNGNNIEYKASRENRYGISEVSVNVGDKFVTVDGKKIEFENEIINIKDVIRVPLSLTKQLGFTLNGIHVGSGYSNYYFRMDNPKYEKNTDGGNWFENLF